MSTRKDRSKKSKTQDPPGPKTRRTASSQSQLAEHAELEGWRQMQDDAFRAQPRLSDLVDRLREHGGGLVILLLPEPDLDLLLEHGSLFDPEGLRMQTGGLHVERGDPPLARQNTARLWWQSRGRIRIVSGYALHESGSWVRHWWGLEEGRIVETTVRLRHYFGAELSFKQSLQYALSVPQLSDEMSNALELESASFPRGGSR